MNGQVQIYTGNGKGKTTAALGLVVRACGAGLKVYFGQFLKGRMCSEIKALRERFPEVTVVRHGSDKFIKGTPSPEDITAARAGLSELRKAMLSGKYDVVVADELNVVLSLGMIAVEEILDLIKARPPEVELVLTGRDAPEQLILQADLVTEMKEIKHYFNKGVKSRLGIEL
jgi:cob(I)alamin adenosyltransferase